MGTWIGHIAPGFFFICFALWWHINNCIRYLRSFDSNSNTEKSKQRSVKFRGSSTYPCFWLPWPSARRVPIESILKILITSIHFTIELYTGYYPTPTPHLGDENAHHTAMLFGFFLGAWVEVLAHYGVPLPPRYGQVMGVLAFAMEALMMVFHLHARSMIDSHIHQLLALTMTCSMLGALAECLNPNNFWLIIGRSFFALTQGTWFLQAAFVIWPQTTNPLFIWDPNSHRSVSLLTMSYAYHLAGNAFILLMMYLFIYMLSSSKPVFNYGEEDDNNNNNESISSEYKLILSMNDDDQCV